MTRGRLTWRWAALGFVALLTLLMPLLVPSAGDRQPEGTQTPHVAGASQPALFFSPSTFFEAARAAESAPQPGGSVAGGIIPHHWLAGYLITGFFQGLADGEPPSTIVLLGPDHHQAGGARAVTSDLPWETPFGLVEPGRQQISLLAERGLVKVENAILTTEHSVAGIMPAIKYYLPDARVVPIILSGETSSAEARRLGEALAAQSTDGTVVVAAVDFSHYLVQSEAARHDAFTLEAIRASDTDTLLTLDDAYLDSPPSIAVLMEAMAALAAGPFVLLENTSSGALVKDELAPTTSYIVGYYQLTGSPGKGQAASLR